MRIAIPCLVFLAACVSTSAVVLNPQASFAPTCQSAVRLYLSPDKVGFPFTEVAVLEASGIQGHTDSDMTQSMRKKAAELGANGIILSGFSDPSESEKLASQIRTGLDGFAERKGRALAIRVASDTAGCK